MSRVAQHPMNAFAAALGAVAILSIMDAVMKGLVIALGIFAVSVWRSAANLAMSAALYLPHGHPLPARKRLEMHVARGVLVMVMAALFFWGIARVPLAQGIALTFIAPLLSLLLAALFLHEQIGSRSVVGSVIAFVGVLVIVVGQASAHLGPKVLIGSASILGSAICYAANIVMMRRQALAAQPLEINFFQSVTIACLWLAAVPVFGLPRLPGEHAGWIIVASMMSTAGSLLFAWAYARAEASYLAVTEYSAFLWASSLGWLVFHERVSAYTLAGAALIVGGCLLAAWGKSGAPPEIDLAV